MGAFCWSKVVVFANATCGCSFCTLDSRLVISLPGPVTAGFLLVRSADPNHTSSKPPWLQEENHLQRGPFSNVSVAGSWPHIDDGRKQCETF